MATLKDIRRRIRSVQNTQQITKAMEMVAAAKLRRAQERSVAARPYARKMTEIMESLSGAAAELSHPLFEVRPVNRRALVVVTSDKGLCGSFNANVQREALNDLKGDEAERIDLVLVGKRAVNFFRKRPYPSSLNISDLGDQVDLEKVRVVAGHVVRAFTSGEVDQVDFLYTRFLTTARRRVVKEKLLPITPEETGEGETEAGATTRGTIFEPSAEAIFTDLLPRYVQTRVMSALADSIASEHAARLISMGAATKNAGEMISALTLVRNKLRQAAITKEISELVGGAEALK
ncbi:MAG: ATP synthase F1 subunit gamma [Candidatus Eisenbacteria bacterium]|nr:ATP synthase F1 subunit gamma [Candidatus Latescibacterota bacterium]MBD3301491.1 ATP synthase F1 subunit gamma [Candidatus Eisenbacteria bacterium]